MKAIYLCKDFFVEQLLCAKAPGQDLAKNGRFPMIPEEKFNSRPRGRQMAEICFQKARPFPNDPRREIQ